MRRRLFLAAFALPLTFAAPAAAVEPTRETVHLTNRLTSTCPNGDVLVGEFTITQERTTFFDIDGPSGTRNLGREDRGHDDEPHHWLVGPELRGPRLPS